MIRLLAAVIALLLAVPAAAHQQKASISTVSNNPQTGLLEVVHRVPLHDAEHALRARGTKAVDVIANIDSRRAFARYVSERFEIVEEDTPIALTLLGTEIEGRNLLVYQEAPSPGSDAKLSVKSQILTDIWAQQENRVNFGTGTNVDTLVFRSGDGFKIAILP